jgi:hypothetical protein
MEGILFYWISWSFWIYFTFIMRKLHPGRTRLAAAILILIILSPIHFAFGQFKVYGGAVFILLTIYMYLTKERKRVRLYFFISSFIVAVACSTFRLFEIFDPVWLFLKREWMLGVILCYLTFLLQKSLKWRCFTLLAGGVQGEILSAFLLRKYGMAEPIAALGFLDVCAAASLLMFLWSGVKQASVQFENYFTYLEKENQKSS